MFRIMNGMKFKLKSNILKFKIHIIRHFGRKSARLIRYFRNVYDSENE